VTHVVHLAAQLVRGGTPVDRFYDINAFGTLRLLEGVIHAGLELERFLLASTDGTYRPGDPPAVPLTEDAPQEPADYYGTSKLLSEIILRNHGAQFDVPFSIVRFATVVSPEEAARYFRLSFIRTLFQRAELGRDSNIWQLFREHPEVMEILDAYAVGASDDTAIALVGPEGSSWTLHMVDVRDAVEGVYRALTEPAALGRAFNIAGPEPTSYDEAASVLSELFGVPKLTVQMPMTWRLELGIDAARTILGYRPRYDYRSSVATVLAGARTDEEAFIPARLP
jgi:nucleoside-diphosphate-sugar epimerase